MMIPTCINYVKKNFFGPNSLSFLEAEIKNRGFKRALIITDKFLAKSNVIPKVENILINSHVVYSIFDDVLPNPTVSIVNEGFKKCLSINADFLIAVGGGSSIDTSKAIGILATNGGNIEQYEGVNKSTYAALPIIAINTTAGTGSEVTSFYVITDEIRHSKMVMVDTNCMVSIAVNDPELMLSMPKNLTAATGMDALTHAIEAYVSTNRSPITDKDALWAIETISKYLPKAYQNGNDIEARTMMAYAQYVAGMAFSNAGLGMVHAMAHSLGGFYNLPHGICNALLLPYIIEYNAAHKELQTRYKNVAFALGIRGGEWIVPYRATQEAILYIKKMIKMLGLPSKLREVGVKEQDFENLAKLALKDACMATNPRQPTVDDIISLYKKAY